MGRTNLLFPLTFSYHEALKQNSVRPLQKIEEYCRNIETSGIGNGSKTSTTNEIINLVKAWRDGKRQELHFVNVAVSKLEAGPKMRKSNRQLRVPISSCRKIFYREPAWI